MCKGAKQTASDRLCQGNVLALAVQGSPPVQARPSNQPPAALVPTLRVATWVGEPGAFAAASLCGPRLPTVSRHGLWLALQLGPDPLFHVPACVLDVRRPDERLAFGAIRGTLNVPGERGEAAGMGGAGRGGALGRTEWRGEVPNVQGGAGRRGGEQGLGVWGRARKEGTNTLTAALSWCTEAFCRCLRAVGFVGAACVTCKAVPLLPCPATPRLAADELAAALALPPAEFRARYGVPPPGPRDVVVTVSRAGRRAAWAAQLCLDAGLGRWVAQQEPMACDCPLRSMRGGPSGVCAHR